MPGGTPTPTPTAPPGGLQEVRLQKTLPASRLANTRAHFIAPGCQTPDYRPGPIHENEMKWK